MGPDDVAIRVKRSKISNNAEVVTKRKRMRNVFIDDEADAGDEEEEEEKDKDNEDEEEEDEDEEEEDEEDEEEDEQDSGRLGAADRENFSGLLSGKKSEDLHALALRLRNKYSHATVTDGLRRDDSITAADQPTPLWRVHVPAGQEAALVKIYFEGLSDFPDKARPLISNAFERSAFIPRSIFLETRDVMSAIIVLRRQSIGGISAQANCQLVPPEDRSALMNLGLRNVDVYVGSWVRVADKGKYRQDLAHVLDVDEVAKTANVLLVPRISLDKRGKRKRAPRTRIAPCILDTKDPNLGSKVKQVGEGRVTYKGKTYRNGLLEAVFPLNGLHAAEPVASELDTFGRTQTIDPSVLTKSWAKWAASSIKQGDRVRVTSGEQAGMVGTAHDVAHEVVTIFPVGGSVIDNTDARSICVPLTDICLHLLVGDYIYVAFGVGTGKSGAIVEVKGDIVTFTDGSTKTGQPEQISVLAIFVRFDDRPIDGGFFPHSYISSISPESTAPESTRNHESVSLAVDVVGLHEFSTRQGVISGAAKWNADGTIQSFWVELLPDNHRVEIYATHLINSIVGAEVLVSNGPYSGETGRATGRDARNVYVELESHPGSTIVVDNSWVMILRVRRGDTYVPIGEHLYLPPNTFITRNREGKHPCIGLRVTITGQHSLCGYNGIIRDAPYHDDSKFLVEVEATHRKEMISRLNLSLQPGEKCTARAAEFFKDHPVLPTPAPKPVRTAPLVPSTPLPADTLAGSPAWDPSSRTPMWHDRFADEGPGESPYHGNSQSLISRPHGRLNRSEGGYNHKESLNLGDDLYAKITNRVCRLIRQHFDLSKSVSQQTRTAHKAVIDDVTQKYPQLKNYKDNWALKDFMTLVLKTEKQRFQRHNSAQ